MTDLDLSKESGVFQFHACGP